MARYFCIGSQWCVEAGAHGDGSRYRLTRDPPWPAAPVPCCQTHWGALSVHRMRAGESPSGVQHIQSHHTRGVTGSCSPALPGLLNTAQGSANKCSEVLPQHSLAVLAMLGITLLASLLGHIGNQTVSLLTRISEGDYKYTWRLSTCLSQDTNPHPTSCFTNECIHSWAVERRCGDR